MSRRQLGRYDGGLQMFVAEEPRTLNLAWLGFLRWLVEQGRLEHEVAGPPAGPCAGETQADETVTVDPISEVA